MSDDFYPFVDSGDPAPTNTHLTGVREDEAATWDDAGMDSPQPLHPMGAPKEGHVQKARDAEAGGRAQGSQPVRTARISVYDDMLSTPHVIVVEQSEIRTYLEEVTNTVYRTMREQGGRLSLMIIRELVENFIHARFNEPIISILDDGNTIRFSDQGPGIGDKELAFEFGVTSADREQKRYIRGTGSGLPMIQQYVENAGGAIAIEDNLGNGTVVTVSVDPERVREIEQSVSRGAAVRGGFDHRAVAQGAVGMAHGGGMSAGYTGADMGGYSGSAGMVPPAGYGMWPQQGAGGQTGLPYYPPQGAGQPMGAAGMPQPPFPGMYPQPPSYGYQQFDNQFSTIQQPYAQPAGMYPPQPMPQQVPPMAETPYISERGLTALRFICENASGGPTDLTRAFGSSNGTWSRELATLSKAGLVHKAGQKYVLTDAGRAWVQRHEQ